MARSVYRKQNLWPSSSSFWLSASDARARKSFAAIFRRRVNPGYADAIRRWSGVSRHRDCGAFELPQEQMPRCRQWQCGVLLGLFAIHALSIDRKRGAPFPHQRFVGLSRFAQPSRSSRFVCDSAQLVDPLRHLHAEGTSREFGPLQRKLPRDLSGTVDARNRHVLCMEFVERSRRAWNRQRSTKGSDYVAASSERRPNLIAIFDRRHQWRLRPHCSPDRSPSSRPSIKQCSASRLTRNG